MAWRIEYLKSARKDVERLDRQVRHRIRDYLEQRVAALDDPRELGKPLKGQLATLWRYRVGSHRVICELRDHEVVVLVVRVGHRKDVYEA